MKTTKVVIEYRDGANYKTSEEYIMEGVLTETQKETLLNLFGENQMISLIPSDLNLQGLKNLCPNEGDDDYDPDLDHPYHSILMIEDTNENPDMSFSIDCFYNKAIAQKK